MAKLRSVWLLIISLLIIGIDVSAQNDVLVNAQVIPPYSPYISSYVDQPNKLIITLQNLTGQTKNIKLWVRIAGDNSVSGTTMPNFKPTSPIVLGPNQFKQIDFSSNETRGYFDAQNINLVGITKAQLIQNQALPEGSYTFCVKALDYNTGAPLSMDQPSGCTAPFPIYYIDPPQALTPQCGGDVKPNTPQSILFSWSPPATAPGNIQYQFTLKEVPNSLNPNDVIKNAAFPVLYSTNVTSITTLLYSVALPQLAKGKKYVWRVRAVDPLNGVQFKNQGYSEACWFNYKSDDVPGFNPNINTNGLDASNITPPNTNPYNPFVPIVTGTQGTVFIPPFISITNVTGKLIYKYQAYPTKYPLQNATIRLVYEYQFQGNGTGNKHYESLCIDGICSGQELDVTTTDADGNFTFMAMPSKPFGLVAQNYVIGTGEFKYTGSVYRVCRIVIENPHKEFYNDPETFYTPELGGTTNTGEVQALVKSCKLQVTIKRSGSASNALENTSMVLANANVYLCRKPTTSYQKKIYPKDDGNPEEQFTAPSELNGLEVVGKYHTNGDGKVTFDKLVYHNNPNFRYYIFADFDKNQTGYYNYVDINGPEVVTYNPDNGSGGITISGGTDQTYFQNIKMYSQNPRVLGVVKDKYDGKPLSGVVRLQNVYFSMGNTNIAYLNSYAPQQEKDLDHDMSLNKFPVIGVVDFWKFVGSDGQFEFDKQSIMYERGTFKAKGPQRVVTSYSAGYDDEKVNINDALHFGEQRFVALEMDRGATIKGKVVDGETGKGLAADFYFIDELKSGSSIAFLGGFFAGYPAKKTTNKQKLVFTCPGYLKDTIEVVINQKEVDLGTIKMYTIKRRLNVIVKGDYGTIKGATVEIAGVSQPCIIKQGNLSYPGNCALATETNVFGSAKFEFVNDGGTENNNKTFSIKITPPNGAEYEIKTVTTKIPYSSTYTTVNVQLDKATCISGHVYAGKNDNSPVANAKLKLDVTSPTYIWYLGTTLNVKTGEVETTTDANGAFTLHNVPLRDYPQIIRAIKSSSNMVGDSFVIVTKPAANSNYYQVTGTGYNSNYYGGSMQYNANATNINGAGINGGNSNSSNSSGCIKHDFHLTIYNGIDITSLMGFPIEVTTLKPYGSNGAEINGYFVDLPGNNQFKAKAGSSVAFEHIKILPSPSIKNAEGVPVATPETTPVITNANVLPLLLYNQLDGVVEDKKLGIYLDKDVGGKQYGVIKGKVKILGSTFNQAVVSFTDTIHLVMPNDNSANKLFIPVINADKTLTNPVNAPDGFKIANSAGLPIKFSLPGFANAVLSDADASYFKDGVVNLTAKIQTNINDISPSNLNITLADIKLKKNVNPSISSANPISFSMGNWKLSSSDFILDQNGLKLNKGTIDAGVQVPFTNLGITYNQLLTNTTNVELNSIKLASVHPLTVTSTNKSFGLINVGGGKKAWQIYAGPTPDIAASITNLPALGVGEKIDLSSISLMSNGQQLLIIKSSAPVTLRSILKFRPSNASPVSVQSDQFLIPGSFVLNIPTPQTFKATLYYGKNGTGLDFKMINLDQIVFTKPTQLIHRFYQNPTLTIGKFVVNGFSEESGVFPKTNTTLYYTTDSVSVWIDPGQNIPIKADKKFSSARGGMRIQGNNWTTFWFDGNVEGMAGISDVQVGGKPQRMKFLINGEVTADGQSIQMKNIETPFGNMTWVYDFPNTRLTGHMDVNMDVSSAHLNGQINSLVDGSGWFFGADGMLKLNGVGDVNFAGVFGNYPTYPAGVPAINTGDFKCLPSAFSGKVNGFMLQAGIHKQLVPETSISIPALLDVGFGVDVGLTARIWKAFAESGSDLGIALLAKGHAFAHGSCSATCTDVSMDANAQIGISGVYHGGAGTYDVTGCGSVHFEIEVKQHPPVPLLPCCDWSACTLTINPGAIDFGVNIQYNSNSGANMSTMFSSCDSQCH